MTKDHTVSQDPSGSGKEGLSPSVAHNDGGAAKTRVNGESFTPKAVADGLALLIAEDLRTSIANLGYPVGMGQAPHPDACRRAAERIIAQITNKALTLLAEREGDNLAAAEALTSLRTERDEALADLSRAELRFGNALARAEGDRRAAEARALKAENAWKPIESAPRDGTHVLLGGGCCVFEGRWLHEEVYRSGGWYELNNDPSDSWGGEMYPTHWMPLPSPPSESQ